MRRTLKNVLFISQNKQTGQKKGTSCTTLYELAVRTKHHSTHHTDERKARTERNTQYHSERESSLCARETTDQEYECVICCCLLSSHYLTVPSIQWHISDVHQLIASALIFLPANNDNQLYQSSCDTFACHSPKYQTTGMILYVAGFFTVVRPCTVRCSDIVNRTVRFGVVVIDCILRFGSVRVLKRGNPTGGLARFSEIVSLKARFS